MEHDKHTFLEKALWVILLIVLFGGIIIFTSCTPKQDVEQEPPKWSAVELLKGQHPQELSEWAKLQMAIIYTESRFRSDITGKDQDGGLYQMTPIFVAEVNRIAGTNYTHEDVYDPDKAIEIFNTMHLFKQTHGDFEKALRIHNKNAGYASAVMQNYELICRMEEVRAKLVNNEKEK